MTTPTIPDITINIDPPLATDPRERFSLKAFSAWLALSQMAPQLNAFGASMRDVANLADDAITASQIAVAAANFRGDYSAVATYTLGQSVAYSGYIWLAKKSNTGIVPAEGANWLRLVTIPPVEGQAGKFLASTGAGVKFASIVDEASVGTVIRTFADLRGKGWVLADGAVYQKAVYPELAAAVGQPYGKIAGMVKQPDPASAPTELGTMQVATTADGSYFLAGGGTAVAATNSLVLYKRSGHGYTQLAGTAIVGNIVNNAIYAIAWSADGIYCAVGHSAAPYLSIFKRTGDVLTKLTDPTTPASAVRTLAWSDDGAYLAVGTSSATFLHTYARSSDAFTKLASAATLPTGAVYGVDWSPGNTYLAVASQNSSAGRTQVYTHSSGIPTLLTDMALSALPGSLDWSPDAIYLAVAVQSTSGYVVYKRTGTAFAAVTTPSVGGACFQATWSASGLYLIISSSSSPISAYKRTGDALAAVTAPLATALPAGAIGGVAIGGIGGSSLLIGRGSGAFNFYEDSAYALFDPITEFQTPVIAPTVTDRTPVGVVNPQDLAWLRAVPKEAI